MTKTETTKISILLEIGESIKTKRELTKHSFVAASLRTMVLSGVSVPSPCLETLPTPTPTVGSALLGNPN